VHRIQLATWHTESGATYLIICEIKVYITFCLWCFFIYRSTLS